MTEFVKLSISVPREEADAARAAVAQGDASSVSAYIVQALEHHRSRMETLAWAKAMRGGRAITPEARAWALRALGVVDDGVDDGRNAAPEETVA